MYLREESPYSMRTKEGMDTTSRIQQIDNSVHEPPNITPAAHVRTSVVMDVLDPQLISRILIRVYGNSRGRGSARGEVILLAVLPFGRPNHVQRIIGNLVPGRNLDDREVLRLLAAVVRVGARLGREELVSRLDPSSRQAERWGIGIVGVPVGTNVTVPLVVPANCVGGGELHVGRGTCLESKIIPLERLGVDQDLGVITRVRVAADGGKRVREVVIGLNARQ